MAAAIATKEPTEFRAGDSVLWSKSLADYSAAEWSLVYYLVGPGPKLTIAATADGSDFAVEITATQTATLQQGEYYLEGKVTDGSQVFTVFPLAAVTVHPNLADNQVAQQGFDGRTYWRKVLDTLKDMYSGAAAFPEQGYQFFGDRQVQLKTFDDVQKAIQFVEGKIREEEIKANPSAKNIYVRLRAPR